MNGSDERIRRLREFNRFYTRRIGALNPRFLASPFSLTEARILFEVARGQDVTAKELARELELDPGYLSRTLSRLEKSGVIRRKPSALDRRRRPITLTSRGRRSFLSLDRRQSREVRSMLAALSASEQKQLVSAMTTIQELL